MEDREPIKLQDKKNKEWGNSTTFLVRGNATCASHVWREKSSRSPTQLEQGECLKEGCQLI